jgi:hypothetical protein
MLTGRGRLTEYKGMDWKLRGWVRKSGVAKQLVADGDTITFKLSDPSTYAVALTRTSPGDITRNNDGSWTDTVQDATTDTIAVGTYHYEVMHTDGISGDKTILATGEFVVAARVV